MTPSHLLTRDTWQFRCKNVTKDDYIFFYFFHRPLVASKASMKVLTKSDTVWKISSKLNDKNISTSQEPVSTTKVCMYLSRHVTVSSKPKFTPVNGPIKMREFPFSYCLLLCINTSLNRA